MGIMEKKMVTTLLGLYIPYFSIFGYPKYSVPYYDRDPKRDHNFDNIWHMEEVLVEINCQHPATTDWAPIVLIVARLVKANPLQTLIPKTLNCSHEHARADPMPSQNICLCQSPGVIR